jgi:cytochrome c-type biogenesis protein CcmH
MTLWFVFALMTAAAIFAVLWPLGRGAKAMVPAGNDVVVYRDQLEEIDRDRAAGLIGEVEAEAARVEVSRRLIAAAETQKSSAIVSQLPWRRRAAALAALILLPAGAVALYITLGSPNLPGEPAYARAATPQGGKSIGVLVSEVEAHLERNPSDGRGWEVIAPVYVRLGRFDDAVRARRNALALNGDSSERQSGLGEALVGAANGVVTAEAKAAFERAVAEDSHNVMARYYLGLAAEQDGKRDQAASIWRGMLANASADAPWRDYVRAALARIGAEPTGTPGPSADDVAAASSMDPAERLNMIRGMVDRLATRLHGDGGDVDGWLRLVRAYRVLGDRDKAKGAASDARRALANDPEQLKRVDEFVKGLGLEG